MTTLNLLVDTPTGRVPVTALVASTAEERQRGYLRREAPLHDHTGILFVFSVPTREAFHMRGVSFDLDLIIGDKSGLVTGAARMAADSDKLYAATAPIDWALEVRSGWIQRHGAPSKIVTDGPVSMW